MNKDQNDGICKTTYIDMVFILYNMLIPDGDTESARKLAELDWNKDSQGKETMDKTLFFEAIFEFTNGWSETCELDEYVNFLLINIVKDFVDLLQVYIKNWKKNVKREEYKL